MRTTFLVLAIAWLNGCANPLADVNLADAGTPTTPTDQIQHVTIHVRNRAAVNCGGPAINADQWSKNPNIWREVAPISIPCPANTGGCFEGNQVLAYHTEGRPVLIEARMQFEPAVWSERLLHGMSVIVTSPDYVQPMNPRGDIIGFYQEEPYVASGVPILSLYVKHRECASNIRMPTPNALMNSETWLFFLGTNATADDDDISRFQAPVIPYPSILTPADNTGPQMLIFNPLTGRIGPNMMVTDLHIYVLMQNNALEAPDWERIDE